MADRRTFTRWGPPVGWLLWTGMLQWSVVRFREGIVLTVTGAAIGLGLWLARRVRWRLSRGSGALALVGSVVLAWAVPLFSHLASGPLLLARTLVTVIGLTSAALLWSGRLPGPSLWIIAVVGHVALSSVVIIGAPEPTIDVWAMLQQGADQLAAGDNVYVGSTLNTPGVRDFTYLPWSSVLLAPGRWLFGDVRWALMAWTVALLASLALLAQPRDRRDAAWLRVGGVAAALVVLPGSITQIDQSWTEPLLLALLVLWAALVHRGHPGWAMLPLALACASKQHLALLVPLLVAWRAFGWRRSVATGALSALLISPWLLDAPADFLHDTVTMLVTFHPIRFANTWYLLVMHRFGVALPFWVTGLVVLATVLVATRALHRRQPGIEVVLRWMALVLLVANLVNKQAFYNQYWLSAGLVLASLVVSPRPPVPATGLGPPR